jgi:hypothetical protein
MKRRELQSNGKSAIPEAFFNGMDIAKQTFDDAVAIGNGE